MTEPTTCDDCARKGDRPTAGPQCYAVCSICNVKRACFGTDPDPIAPRKIRIPEWPKSYPLR